MPTVEEKIAAAKAQMMKEGPDIASKANIGPMGFFSRLLAPSNAVAITNPWTGSVYYNPAMMQDRSQQDINSDLAHELVHTRQVTSQSWPQRIVSGLQNAFSTTPYMDRPNEQEAFQAEKDRNLAQHLPVEGDINLPTEGLKRAKPTWQPQ